MKRKIKIFSGILIFAAATVVLFLAMIIAFATITDYKPLAISELEIQTGGVQSAISDSTLTFLSWNVGYFGLGAEMDFFYEGGKMVNPEKEQVEKFSSAILNFLKQSDSIDFIILQEVDKNSARTNKQDQTSLIREYLPNFSSSFGFNYKVKFVPLPFTNPVGKVEMGQMSLSKYQPVSSQRYSYFSEYAWPKQLFMLDRCFVVSRFNLADGKQLVLLNTHNSAYDPDGKLRKVEMPLIRNFMLEEYNKGNYVVAGGDWNQNPPEYNPETVDKTYVPMIVEIMDSAFFPPDWKFACDPLFPTNRILNIPLTKGESEVTIIDYFILSPNIEVEEIKTLQLGFQNSDHEPLFLKIKLK